MANGKSLEEQEAEHRSKEDARNQQRQERQERMSQESTQTDDEKLDAMAARMSTDKPKPKTRAKKKTAEKKTEEVPKPDEE